MAGTERYLVDELRAARRRETELLQTIRDLTDRIMYLTGKPYAPTPLDLFEPDEPDEPSKDEDETFPGMTSDPELVGL